MNNRILFKIINQITLLLFFSTITFHLTHPSSPIDDPSDESSDIDEEREERPAIEQLHYAALTGNIEQLTAALDTNIDPNALDISDGDVALFKTVQTNNITGSKVLIERKANVNAYTFNNTTPLEGAILQDNLNMILFLIKHKAEVNILKDQEKTSESPLSVAIKKQNPSIIELLIKNKAQLNPENDDENIILHWAAANSNSTVVRLLLDNNCSLLINQTNQYGNTPLMCSTINKLDRHNIIQLLLAHRANPNMRNHVNKRAVHMAAEQGDHLLTKTLLDAKAQPE